MDCWGLGLEWILSFSLLFGPGVEGSLLLSVTDYSILKVLGVLDRCCLHSNLTHIYKDCIACFITHAEEV